MLAELAAIPMDALLTTDYSYELEQAITGRTGEIKRNPWVDYFLTSDVYMFGLGMDPSEADLWYLIAAKNPSYAIADLLSFIRTLRQAPHQGMTLCTVVHIAIGTKEDQLLEGYGYRRTGSYYSVERESTETSAFFCHFGVSCVLLSHLWNCTPYQLWHSLCMLPSSVTELVTEERKRGIASFRALRIGDTQHLTRAGVEPSFSVRFCEVYSNMEQRH